MTEIRILNTTEQMQSFSGTLKKEGKKIAFVPTMGALHEGHLSLIREGKRRGDILIVSIFVNPTQFGPSEDYLNYARDINEDIKKLKLIGADAAFVPKVETIYPDGFQTYVEVEKLEKPLCGENRPGHFKGVATVVLKLFNIVKPDIAIFGRKDYQQLKIIERMVKDLNLEVEVLGMPIVREQSGLALSSRNGYLTPEDKERAAVLYKALVEIKNKFDSGVRIVDDLIGSGQLVLKQANLTNVDYLEIKNGETLTIKDTAESGDIVAVAAKIGKSRLIDNTML